MEIALLEILGKAGGQLHVSSIYPLLTSRFQDILTPRDLSKVNKSGDNTWKNRIRWLRENLIPKDELRPVSHGIWAITNKGLARIGQNQSLRSKSFYLIESQYRQGKGDQRWIDMFPKMCFHNVVSVGLALHIDL